MSGRAVFIPAVPCVAAHGRKQDLLYVAYHDEEWGRAGIRLTVRFTKS